MEAVWLNEGDFVITKLQREYFEDLVDFVNEKNLKEEFWLWQKQRDNKVTKK